MQTHEYQVDDVVNPAMQDGDVRRYMQQEDVSMDEAAELFAKVEPQYEEQDYDAETAVENGRFGDVAVDTERGFARFWDEEYQEDREVLVVGMELSDDDGETEYGMVAVDLDEDRLDNGFYGALVDGETYDNGVEEDVLTAVNRAVRDRWEGFSEEDDTYPTVMDSDEFQYQLDIDDDVWEYVDKKKDGTFEERVRKTLRDIAEDPERSRKRGVRQGYWEVDGDHRVVGTIDEENDVVRVEELGKHKDYGRHGKYGN